MTEESLPTVVSSGSFHLFGVEVKCHTLSDGRRIIEEASFIALLDAMASGKKTDIEETTEFVRWQKGLTP